MSMVLINQDSALIKEPYRYNIRLILTYKLAQTTNIVQPYSILEWWLYPTEFVNEISVETDRTLKDHLLESRRPNKEVLRK